MATNHEILGRNEVDDLEAILAITNSDVDEVQHLVQSNGDAIFTWDYDRSRPALGKLYERAKKSQWNAQTDLPWDTDVDQEHVVLNNALANNMTFGSELDTKGTPFEKWGDAEWLAFGVQSQNWTLSQFLHGEQGALICTAKVVETVPWIDAKYYAATQVMDEARHVEVFAKYLDEKLSGHYPINAHLRLLLGREHLDDAVDRLGGVGGVQGAEHEVTGVGRLQRETNRLEVAHFADEDDVRVLAERAAQGRGERLRV